jgi:hypothetical protein
LTGDQIGYALGCLKFVVVFDVKTTAVESLVWIITGGGQQEWVQKRLKLKAICNFAKLVWLIALK